MYGSGRGKVWKTKTRSNRSGNAQIANLLKDLLYAGVQLAIGVLVSCIRIEVLLHLRHPGVCFGAEAQLNLDQRFEAGVEVRHPQVDQLWEFVEQLLVELLVCLLGHLRLSLGAWQFGRVLVGLLDQLLDLGSHRIVIEELVVSLLDALVDIGEVGTEAGDRLENGLPEENDRKISCRTVSRSREDITGRVHPAP